VPHAQLRTPAGDLVSTLDLGRPGRLTLLVSPTAAEAWRDALAEVSHPLARMVDLVAIGPGVPTGAAHGDVDGRWAALREVEEDGAVLVRPDTIVAWRSVRLPAAPAEAIAEAMTRIVMPSAHRVGEPA
jgi:2,4-dichlorophenol 6-monooxygenase